MADLSTTYLGLKLKSPVVLAASSLSNRVENFRVAEEHGAGAVVLRSLFEEQIEAVESKLQEELQQGAESQAEALSYFPSVSIGPREYLQLVEKSKRAVRIPIIASLNCIAPGSWASYAKQIQDAGADALEVNIYALQADPSVSAEAIEQRYLDTVSAVQEAVKIPVSVKLSPYFTALAHFAGRLDRQGVKGLVLFNRFLQPDISVERLELDNVMPPSNPHEALVPLRWIALLHGRVQADLAATTGVYDASGVVKQLLAGATVVQVAWTLLKNGVPHVASLVNGLDDFMDKRGYSELVDMRGLLSQKALKDPGAFERAQYVHLLLSQVS